MLLGIEVYKQHLSVAGTNNQDPVSGVTAAVWVLKLCGLYKAYIGRAKLCSYEIDPARFIKYALKCFSTRDAMPSYEFECGSLSIINEIMPR